MAYVKIFPIKHDLKYAITYNLNKNKTWWDEGGRYLFTGVGIDSMDEQIIYEQFVDTKKCWGKNKKKRLAYHAIQSFAPGEVTPDQAHKIGVEYAEEVWGDRFEVLVSTHLDKGHLHNHFLINSVSYVDGYMYHESNGDYRDILQRESDRICAEHGLSVIAPKKDTRHKSRPEVKPENGKTPTMHTLIYQDIDNAIQMSTDLNSFYNVLRQMGYQVKRYGANGQPLAHPAIKPPPEPDGREHHFFRIDKFTDGYTEQDIDKRIKDRMRGVEDKGQFMHFGSEPGAKPSQEQTKKINYWQHLCGPTPKREMGYMYSGVIIPFRVIRYRSFLYHNYFYRRRYWFGLRRNFTKFCFVLKSVERTSYPKYPSHVLRREVAKLHRYRDETMLLHRYKIDTLEQLADRQAIVDEGIFNLNSERRRLRREIKNATPEEAEQLKPELEHYNNLAKDLYKERALIKDIAERSEMVTQTIEREQQQAVEQLEHDEPNKAKEKEKEENKAERNEKQKWDTNKTQ